MFSSLSGLASSIAIVVPLIQQLCSQLMKTALAVILIAGNALHQKPHIPSQAEIQCLQLLKDGSTHQLLDYVSRNTGVVIKPEFINQLNRAGMHHDFAQLAELFSQIESTQGTQGHSALKEILENKIAQINPYGFVRGVKAFEELNRYPFDCYSYSTAQPLNSTVVPIASLTGRLEPPQESPRTAIKVPETTIQHTGGEFPITYVQQTSSKESVAHIHQKLMSASATGDRTQSEHSSKRLRAMFDQSTQFSIDASQNDFQQFQSALHSVLPHFQDPSLRSQLTDYSREYIQTLKTACQIGASPEIIYAQTQIATQGLPLPGFLQWFSDALQEKTAPLCFDRNGTWKGLENQTELEKFKQTIQAYQAVLYKLSNHLEYQSPAKAQSCIENLYVMDQGWGWMPIRFFKWIANKFNSNAISYEELRSRILQNSFNNQSFTALELLNKKEYKLARIPLEHMNQTSQTTNGILLHNNLFNTYKRKIQSEYGVCKLPLKYQNDPVYWLYKPSLESLADNDPKIQLAHAHLEIRNALFNEINHALGINKSSTPILQHIVYSMIDTINDPLALIDQVNHLSSDSQNPEIQNACSALFDKGILKLFDLKKQAKSYGITLPDSINLQRNAELRAAANKLLLIDAQTEPARRSLKLALECIPHACQAHEHADDYKNIILAIAQAHTKAGTPTGALMIRSIPVPDALADDLNAIILKAAGKAALNDISQSMAANIMGSSPLTDAQAWEYISEIQKLAQEGKMAHAKALAETYLQGYLDEQMPWKKHMARALGATAAFSAAGSGIWLATSGDQQKQLPRIIPQGPPEKSNLPDDEDEDEKNKKDLEKNITELLRSAQRDLEKAGGAKIYEKTGTYEDAVKDFENLNPSNIRNIPGKIGKIGHLPNNRTIHVRLQSSDTRATLELYNKITKKIIFKIRYGIK